ncbi:MarR family transcriptional regulator [Actinomadura rudentiformis]|uniref:MarR family transcriptional regulator n=2 Tax=Actinomadura rudentiformis TaxID=359158 RepID=A0A6H9YIA4_9ACTN|nr:MarR family transcriptional regulator [Actinomadura rudentiformis]
MDVSPETVRGYKKEMPEPDRYMGRSPVWRRRVILDWIAARPAAGWNGQRPGRRRPAPQTLSG